MSIYLTLSFGDGPEVCSFETRRDYPCVETQINSALGYTNVTINALWVDNHYIIVCSFFMSIRTCLPESTVDEDDLLPDLFFRQDFLIVSSGKEK